ncbi:protein-disulfide reductase DsbD domain-containing protein [Pseudooceanicola sp.]|jgi:DsbC/DsbD-like thiol-disulfide interchange protein|uniref:protein-disulfide reductase DsbD domain-containing protein n=1 Tax=Pseudooceanicola sp. TaxID=1914328 RepID=UPI00405946E0|tara:strand:+ start:5431 stop:6252 length:822 start_codon:yes stop_codon:yes gene_type:complete
MKLHSFLKRFGLFGTFAGMLAASPLGANPYADNVAVRLLPGWRQADGSHMAAVEVTMAEGWKTYWRAPGDAGVPPVFNWNGSTNVRGVQVIWPRPEVFWQNGMRSIGYHDRLVLPLRVTSAGTGAVALDGELQFGICSDICVPMFVAFDQVALPAGGRPVPAIAAALADRPYERREAGVGQVTCQITPGAKSVTLRAEIEIPQLAADEVVVVETADPAIWVSEAATHREGGRLIAETEMMQMNGGPMMLDRSGVRLTVLGPQKAVDIRGCSGR